MTKLDRLILPCHSGQLYLKSNVKIEEYMKYLLGILILLSSFSLVFAQNTFEFLRLDMSPRAAALAGSYVANDDDPNVIFYNPAGLNFLKDKPASFSFLKHLVDINSASLTYSQEVTDIGRFGVGVQYINYGTFTEADANGNQLGEFGANEFALLVGYGNELGDNLFYGANVKFIYSGIADYSATGIAMDLGLHYTIPDDDWSFGLSILNFGTQISSYFDKDEDLPTDMRFGISKALPHTPFKFYLSLNRLVDKYDNFTDRFKQLTAGAEIRFSSSLKLRIGYDNEKRKDYKVGTTAGLAGFNIGVGFAVSDYTIDYAFSSMGSIGALHRFGVSTTF